MLSRINLTISKKLHDRKYRHRFFRGLVQDEVAHQLRHFRSQRELSQAKLAKACGMKQSAVSRLEQASYARWGIQTIFRLAEALDVRVRVVIDDWKDAVRQYELLEAEQNGMARMSSSGDTVLEGLATGVSSSPTTDAEDTRSSLFYRQEQTTGVVNGSIQ